ncbi:HET-domain-containing protein [Parathielavia appendiculata]|uniref:HET-domain-containing protein n=1 Tax=Parathielavia appendiculata TaxID=2587402 RepID=A0AAN6YZZ0_9PEZI|nr:HET-domain-containing protein [Parathielavia appendiculata]
MEQKNGSSFPSPYISFDQCITQPPLETFVEEFRQEMVPLLGAYEKRKSSWVTRAANKVLRHLFHREPVLTFPVDNIANLLSHEDRLRLTTDTRGDGELRITGPEVVFHSFEDAAGSAVHITRRSPRITHTGLLSPDSLNPFLRPRDQSHASYMKNLERAIKPDTYVAMSYAWGPPKPTAQIMVNGKNVPVRANLEAGLREFRKLDYFRLGGKLWVDSLCINQADESEKEKQVQIMASIYSHAANVIVWLGLEEPGSDLAIQFLEDISADYRAEYLEVLDKSDPLTATTWRTMAQIRMDTRYINFRKNSLKELGDSKIFAYFEDIAASLYDFFNRPYWRRLWIIQELCMGRAGMPIVCGSRITQWRYIRDGALRCTAILDILREVTGENIRCQRLIAEGKEHSLLHVAQIAQLEIAGHRSELPKLPPNIVPILAPNLHEHGPLLGSPIRRAITLTAQTMCSVQHDRIYGMLNIRGLPDLDIKVDYSKDIVTVFTEFSEACIKHGSMDFFSLLDGGFMSLTDIHGNQQQREKPSWVPDYGAKPERRIGIIDGNWHAGGYVHISWGRPEIVDRTLVCTGKVVDMIDGVGAMSRADIQSGTMILTEADPLPRIVQPTGAGAMATRDDGGEDVIYDVLVGGCDINGAEAPKSFKCLYSAFPVDEPPKHSTFYRNWHFLKSSANFLVNGRPLSTYFTHLADAPAAGNPACQQQECTPSAQSGNAERHTGPIETSAARQAMEARTKMRRLVMTTSGLLGLAPAQTQSGDAVIAIIGHGKPVIARKVTTIEGQDVWYLIGETYIHGMMRAEKMPMSTKEWHARETMATLGQVGPIPFV